MTQQGMTVSDLLARLKKQAKVEVHETRTLHDGTQFFLLVGRLPIFPKGARPTWYPLIVRKGQTHIERREVEAITRHFWQYQLNFFQHDHGKQEKHTKSALRKS